MDPSVERQLIDWLLSPATRPLGVENLLEQLAARLELAGLRLLRLSTSVRTLHPMVYVINVQWRRGCAIEVGLRTHDIVESPAYRDSPVAAIHQGSDTIRRQLRDPAALDYPICRELAQEGASDYIAHPLLFGDGRRSFVSFATDAPDGFPGHALALLEALLPALALRIELDSASFALRHLLEVYLGANAARRVMEGSFRRGTGQLIRAAIWFCDLRGFTEMSDQRSPGEVVVALDRYFERVANAVATHGGEVLKFIGDAQLAIFPVDAESPTEACHRALCAAEAALGAMRAYNAERAEAGEPAMNIGVALHLGEVMYGNIGARDRLDFTVIGASVNEVCRLEALCKPLRTALVASAAFALASGDARLVSLGSHSLKGVRDAQEVLTLPGWTY